MYCKHFLKIVASFYSAFVASSPVSIEVLKLPFRTDALNVSENCFQNTLAWER